MTRFIQVDAFTDRPFAGNPAAVMLLDSWPDDAVLQAIAAENNLAETAFLVPVGRDHELRWFTPVVEVAMCGHATLASGHVLLGDDATLATVRFHTRRAGVLTVGREADGYALDLPAWRPRPRAMPEIAAAVGGAPADMLWHDAGYAAFVYSTEAEIRTLSPDFAALARLGNILAIATAPGDETDIVSRVFAPGAGIDEDPVTGSAHAVIAPYWADRLGRDRFTAFQASQRGGHLVCVVSGDRVILSGQCVTVIEGRFRLPS